MENTNDNTIQQMIDFICSHYSLRYNTLLHCTEYSKAGTNGNGYTPLDPRSRNRMTLEVQLDGINASTRDVRNYLESDYIRPFNPIEEYLNTCDGIWDGHDHIADLADTVPTDTPMWREWFGTWLLAMVSQWRHCDGREYGNSVAPLLISPQGYNKSTFCRRLLPQELAWGYNDSIDISQHKQVMTAMSQQLLINLDEFNQIPARVQQGFLKNVIQLPTVKMKRPFGTHIEDIPRTASFIATSNITDILTDPSGNRRFIGIELTAPIDISRTPNHRQLYAQALHLLRHGSRPWFDNMATRQIMQWNRRYEIQEPAEQYFRIYFMPATYDTNVNDSTQHSSGTAGVWLSAAEIFDYIKRRVGSSLKVTSLTAFGRKLANMPDLKRRRLATGVRYLVAKSDTSSEG